MAHKPPRHSVLDTESSKTKMSSFAALYILGWIPTFVGMTLEPKQELNNV